MTVRNKTLTCFNEWRYSPRMKTTHIAQPLIATGAEAAATSSCCGVAAPPSLGATDATTLTDRLRALADPTRLRMLDLLVEQPKELCVCDITSQFDLHQPTISHHLRILREAGLVASEKRGVWSFWWATEEGRRNLSLVRTLA